MQRFTDSHSIGSQHTLSPAGGKPDRSPLRQVDVEIAVDRLVMAAIFDALGTGKVESVLENARVVRAAIRQ